jgi:tyrosine-protein kinase Etk/Wzc
VDNQIVALKQERDELRQNFTAEHPRVQAVDQRLQRLKERRGQFDADVNKLPDTQQKVLQLARDVEVSTTLHQPGQHRPAAQGVQGRHRG